MGRVDIHIHILPGVDDGAVNMQRSVEMAKMAIADGTTHIVASPHANYSYKYDRERYTDLLAELAAQAPGIEFKLGCDFHLSYDNVRDAKDNPKRYVIGDSNYVLVEFPDFGSPDHFKMPVFEMQSNGFHPIITHPERNPVFLRDITMVEYFRNAGCLIQITANSITGAWGRGCKKYSADLLKKGWVDIICSDAHGLQRRPPILSEAEREAAKIVGADVARRMLEATPMKVFRGEAI